MVVHTRKLEVVAGVICTSVPSVSKNTQQLETTDPPSWPRTLDVLLRNFFHSESTSVSEIASTNSSVGLRSAAETGSGGATKVDSKVGLTCASPTVLEVCCLSSCLTRELGKFVFNAVGIDHDRNRHSPKNRR